MMPQMSMTEDKSLQRNTVVEQLPAPILVDTPAAFDAFLQALSTEHRLALDTESDSLYRYFYKVCMIQVSTGSIDYLLDPLRLPDLRPLGQFLADPSVQKVFHAAENDILLLKRDFKFSFNNIFDTMLAARILGRRGVGLAALLREHFGVELDKRVQLTDWGHRPLTGQQLSYARLDSRFLLPLCDLLTDELHAKRRWREAQEAFADLPDLQFVEKPFDPEGFWRSKDVRDLRPSELAIFRELYVWRDQQARTLDQPPFKVMSDQILFILSQEQPHSLDSLPLHPNQTRRFGAAILAAITRGRGAPVPQPPARRTNGEGRPDPEVTARYDRLRAWRTKRAAARGVDLDVILNNETLMAVARAYPTDMDALAALGVMRSWKLAEYGPELLAIIGDGFGS
jgi:ribonuclease D